MRPCPNVHEVFVELFRERPELALELIDVDGGVPPCAELHGLPPEITKDQHHLLVDMEFSAAKATVSCNHVFGTTRMGKDPKTSVTDGRGRCHHTDNLYISDTGIIPISPAVNRMHTLMAMTDRIAGQVHDAH